MMGMSIQSGYFRDLYGKLPTVAEYLMFAGTSTAAHNYYPADESLDVALGPRRSLYFFQPRLATYSIEEQGQAAANLKRFPGEKRKVYICSEPNNTTFAAQYMTPDRCAVAIRDYFHFILTYCPDAEIYGPVVAQARVPNITDPIDYLQDVFSHLKQFSDGLDIIHNLNLAYNHYRRGMTGPQWAATIESDLGTLRYSVAVPWGTQGGIAMPEVGSPNGDASQQDIIAGYLKAIQPTLDKLGVVAHWFTSPLCRESGRGFNGAGDTHYKDAAGMWKLTSVGRALNLAEPASNPGPVQDRFDLFLQLPPSAIAITKAVAGGSVIMLGMTQAEINVLISKIKAVKRG